MNSDSRDGPDVKRDSRHPDLHPSFAGENPPDPLKTTPSNAIPGELSEFTVNTDGGDLGAEGETKAPPVSASTAAAANPARETGRTEGASLTYGLPGDRDRPSEGYKRQSGAPDVKAPAKP